MIYLPKNITNQNCAYIVNEEVIRVYDTKPTTTGNYTYTEYFVDFDYNIRNGVSQFSQYSTFPNCLPNTDFTTNYFYRIDIMNILVSFFILSIFCIYFPFRIFSRIFGRWLKL